MSDGWLKAAVLEAQEYMLLLGKVGRALITPPIYFRDIIEQLDSIGLGSMTVVLLTGTFTGLVLALQSGLTLDQFGARSMVGRLVSASMVKELGPVLTALMVTGRGTPGKFQLSMILRNFSATAVARLPCVSAGRCRGRTNRFG